MIHFLSQAMLGGKRILCFLRTLSVYFFLLLATDSSAQTLSPEVKQFVSVDAPTFALTHVGVIDGTGAPPRHDQTVVVSEGRIQTIGATMQTPVSPGVRVFNYSGHTLIPGLVGMHNHLYYTASADLQRSSGGIQQPGIILNEIPFTAPRLYLACGVTTMRTTGSVEPYTDLKVKERIDAGQMPGPKIDLTAPYLEGPPTPFAQLQELTDAEAARRAVNFWADEGMTSFKAYTHITRDELTAAAEEAHKRGLKITGHLCSVTWKEAVAAGIDDLEHGPVAIDSDFVSDKKADVCPDLKRRIASWEKLDTGSTPVQELIRLLVDHGVAVTSTLPVFETSTVGRPPVQQRVLEAMSPAARASYLAVRARMGTPGSQDPNTLKLLQNEMRFEYAFAKAGGLLLVGPDPTGNGGTLPGFGDQQGVELLVEAGFTPVEAIQIATSNGARYLNRDTRVGTLAAGKQADMVLINGNPAERIGDIEKVVTVFKDGIGYDSAKLIESVRGQVGIR